MMKDPRSANEKRLAEELEAARETIEQALAHIRLPTGRKRAKAILEEGFRRQGHSIEYRLRHSTDQYGGRHVPR